MSTVEKQTFRLCGTDQLNIIKTFECGQCFRWNADENGVYTGVASGKTLTIWAEGGDVLCRCEPENLPFWQDYFDLSTDYALASSCFTQPEYLCLCAQFGCGIRILRQDPWEALCSFIISQCNNIPRIKGIVETLCALYGEPLEDGLFAFPAPGVIAKLTPEDLAPLRAGYRADYILNAARAVSGGELGFERLLEISPDEAHEEIIQLRGIGTKVANCFMLYGLHIMDRFPVDTWMKKALKNHFPVDFDPKTLGDFAGLAQQYIFYYARSEENKKVEISN